MVMVNIPLSTLIEELEVVRNRLREGFWKPTFAIVYIKGISFLSNKLTHSWEVSTWFVSDDESGDKRAQDAKESEVAVAIIRRPTMDNELREMALQIVQQFALAMQQGEIK